MTGQVQGVGFRWWAMSQARDLRLVGYAENLDDGRVEICAQGELAAVATMLRRAVENPTTTRRPGRVTGYEMEWSEPDPHARNFGYF